MRCRRFGKLSYHSYHSVVATKGDMSSSEKVEHLVSAGGVVYREVDNHLEVVLCGRLSPHLWALPKGSPIPGETLEQTALREVREETGLDVAIQGSLGTIQYWFYRSEDKVRCHKTVHYFLMVPKGGETPRHDPEFDVVSWFSESEVLKEMTYANEAAMMMRALQAARKEPVSS